MEKQYLAGLSGPELLISHYSLFLQDKISFFMIFFWGSDTEIGFFAGLSLDQSCQ